MSAAPAVRIWCDALEALGRHAVFGPLVERVGPVEVPPSAEHPFVYLVRAIVYQQLAGAAARTIHGRFVDALRGEVTPEAVLAADAERLRGAGLSRNKLRAILDLAARARSGDVGLDADELAAMADEAIVERLTRVWGVGTWTAQMFLMFRLHRPDVWPVLDLGVRNGWARLHGLTDAPVSGELEALGEPHRPWRSATAWYCWRALEIELPEPD
jgi:3-methyladenine DNA glycosylase/8-oxoguanine DNA glycosylase